jgi:hypothetical protein
MPVLVFCNRYSCLVCRLASVRCVFESGPLVRAPQRLWNAFCFCVASAEITLVTIKILNITNTLNFSSRCTKTEQYTAASQMQDIEAARLERQNQENALKSESFESNIEYFA